MRVFLGKFGVQTPVFVALRRGQIGDTGLSGDNRPYLQGLVGLRCLLVNDVHGKDVQVM